MGHERQLQLLEYDIKSGNLSHAYLFAGPEQVGKFTVAKNLAHILQCPNNFCHECPTCVQIEKGCHSDTIELKNDGESIKIEQIRDVISRLNMSPQSRYKIFLAESIERLTPEAANCLLKTLEEPTPQTIFIFTTGTPRELLQTILSRMRIITFHYLSEATLFRNLTQFFPDIDKAQVQEAVAFATGKSGKAIHLLTDPELLSSHRTFYQELLRIFQSSSIADRFTLLQNILDDDLKVTDFLDILLHVLRGELLKNRSSAHVSVIRLAEQTRQLLKKNVNARLALEHLLLQL